MDKKIVVGVGLVICAGALMLWRPGPGSTPSASSSEPRTLHNPYQDVDWNSVRHVKTQFHDHITNQQRLAAYDQAGYEAVSLFNYSGHPLHTYTWRERRWPVDQWFTKEFLESLRNVTLFFPSAEEIGFQHMTSPFLERYVELWVPGTEATRQLHHYSSGQELIDLIHRWNGLAFLAHPWEEPSQYVNLEKYDAVEIYNSYATSRGRIYRERRLVEFWDRRLIDNPELWGVAVNDWFGPFFGQLNHDHDPPPDATILDSGKTVVLVSEVEPEIFREAVRRGTMFAVKDIGAVKDRYPKIDAVMVDDEAIRLQTDGAVRWISNGAWVGAGAVLSWRQLPAHARYVRAEVSNAEGSVVFTQPFALRRDQLP